jgi:hypothetical protein
MTTQDGSSNYIFNLRFAFMFPSSSTGFLASVFMSFLRAKNFKQLNAAVLRLLLFISVSGGVGFESLCGYQLYETVFFLVSFSHAWQVLVN